MELWKPNTILPFSQDFQTPREVCTYMASLVPPAVRNVLEPTPGQGNIVRALKARGLSVVAPMNFFDIDPKTFTIDCVVANPPFSSKSAFGVPQDILNRKKGMRLGYYIMTQCMRMANEVIVIMPQFTISDSDTRMRFILDYGLVSVTALPRKTFQYARVQTSVFHLRRGFKGDTIFKYFGIEKYQNTLL